MKIISNTTEFYIGEKTAVAIGKFDGIHKGHRALLKKITEAKARGLKAAVMTFEPSPAVFFGLADDRQLTTKEEKRVVLEALGVDYLVEYPMTTESAAVEPEAFISEFLVRKMNASYIAAGADLSYGKRGMGDFALLEKLQANYGYRCEMIEKIREDGVEVSSTLIRRFIEQGEVAKAAAFLGDYYRIQGTVVHGDHRGRKMGMPTINITPDKEKILPVNGVYYSKIVIGPDVFFGITNIGKKPTVQDSTVINAETYIYDFSGNLYETAVEVLLVAYRRGEQKFASVEDLKAQMLLDIKSGRDFFGINA